MATDHRVNSDDETASMMPEEDYPERPRWWLTHPGAGIIAAAILGVATCWVTLSIGRPASAPGAKFIYLVILPIALLLPAIALGGTMVAWHAFRQTRGTMRLMLALPAAIAVLLNVAAIVAFVRWVGRVLLP